MTDTKWYAIEDLYTIEKYKIKHNKNPKTKWIRLPCVYKIKINETTKPRYKLPLSPKNIFGRFKKEKLNIKKIEMGTIIIIKKN